jgi:hypothetical protein
MQASDICLLASRIAKGGTGMVAMAGQFLNVVLEDLKLNRNLKINRVTQLITVTPAVQYGPFPLEADYLRTYDLFYPLPTSGGATSSSETQFLTVITMEQFDEEFKSPSIADYPYEFATDLSTDAQVWSGGSQGLGTLTSAGSLYIYPQTSGTITMTHRYMRNQPDIVNPSTSTAAPWFAFTQYLIDRTAALLMGVTGDDRKEEYMNSTEKMLAPYLIMEGDEQPAVHEVKLDPRKFKFKRGLKPTKASPF